MERLGRPGILLRFTGEGATTFHSPGSPVPRSEDLIYRIFHLPESSVHQTQAQGRGRGPSGRQTLTPMSDDPEPSRPRPRTGCPGGVQTTTWALRGRRSSDRALTANSRGVHPHGRRRRGAACPIPNTYRIEQHTPTDRTVSVTVSKSLGSSCRGLPEESAPTRPSSRTSSSLSGAGGP